MGLKTTLTFMQRSYTGEAERARGQASDTISPWQEACQKQEISHFASLLLSTLPLFHGSKCIFYSGGVTRTRRRISTRTRAKGPSRLPYVPGQSSDGAHTGGKLPPKVNE